MKMERAKDVTRSFWKALRLRALPNQEVTLGLTKKIIQQNLVPSLFHCWKDGKKRKKHFLTINSSFFSMFILYFLYDLRLNGLCILAFHFSFVWVMCVCACECVCVHVSFIYWFVNTFCSIVHFVSSPNVIKINIYVNINIYMRSLYHCNCGFTCLPSPRWRSFLCLSCVFSDGSVLISLCPPRSAVSNVGQKFHLINTDSVIQTCDFSLVNAAP